MSCRTQDRTNWLEATVSSRRLGIGVRSLPRVVELAGIRVREIPGKKGRRYNAADIDSYVERLEKQEAEQVATMAGRPALKRETARTATV